MQDAFTRRGFTRLALFGTAGLFMPSLAVGQALPMLEARFAIEPNPDGLSLRLLLRNRESRGVELLAGALELDGTLTKAHADPVVLRLASRAVLRAMMSRRGFRIGSKLPFPPGEERAYDTFTAAWPPGLGGGTATLDVRARLRVELDERPADEHAGLRALAAIRAPVTVSRPA